VDHPKRHVTVYTDDTKQHRLLEIEQDRKFNFIRASYTVQDPTDGKLGRFEKNYLYNLLRRRWYVFVPTAIAHARARGLVAHVADASDVAAIITVFLGRTNFIMHRHGETQTLGEFNRRFTLFDKYVLDMSADRDHALDRRMAIALGVMLDTGERR